MNRFFKSSIGKKVSVAVTGLVMLGFLAGHMLGNLLVFAGPTTYNHYAEAIQSNLLLLWGTRIVLLVSVLVHIVCTMQLAAHNKQSRPVKYEVFQHDGANLASLFMTVSGLFLGGYIIYHLLHFTVGSLHPDFVRGDVYHNVIIGFSHWPASCIYIAAMVSLGFHLNHGAWSVFQTLGLNHPNYNVYRRCFAQLVSIVIPLGFISVPVSVLLGVIH